MPNTTIKKAAKKARYAANPEKAKANSKRRVVEMSDSYIVGLLIGDSKVLKREHLPQTLIDLKREQLGLKRLTRELMQVLRPPIRAKRPQRLAHDFMKESNQTKETTRSVNHG